MIYTRLINFLENYMCTVIIYVLPVKGENRSFNLIKLRGALLETNSLSLPVA